LCIEAPLRTESLGANAELFASAIRQPRALRATGSGHPVDKDTRFGRLLAGQQHELQPCTRGNTQQQLQGESGNSGVNYLAQGWLRDSERAGGIRLGTAEAFGVPRDLQSEVLTQPLDRRNIGWRLGFSVVHS
jgi:hypothetical protein